MKNVLFITYYFPPSGGPGVQRSLKFVRYLPEFGWKPTVLTVDPAYAAYPDVDKELEREIRQLLYGVSKRITHRVLYEIVDDRVNVLRVLHTSQHPISGDSEIN